MLRHAALLKATLLFALLGLLSACSEPEPWRIQGATMGTTYSVVLSQPAANLSREALAKAIDDELVLVNQQMSTYIPTSELSRFNQHGGDDWFEVSAELVDVVGEALKLHQQSDAAFDATIGPLVNLWGFGPGGSEDVVPSDAAITEAQANVGSRYLAVQSEPAALKKQLLGLQVDLSAIAKGHGVDRIADLLEAQGVRDFLVEIGGELRAHGKSPRGDAWRIAVEKPSTGERAIQQVVEVVDSAVATSGDYRNYFERDGVRYSHTIDARTGRPITHRLASVTVIQPTAARADGLATALMVLGPEDGLALAERLQIPAYFVTKEGEGFSASSTKAFAPLMVE